MQAVHLTSEMQNNSRELGHVSEFKGLCHKKSCDAGWSGPIEQQTSKWWAVTSSFLLKQSSDSVYDGAEEKRNESENESELVGKSKGLFELNG